LKEHLLEVWQIHASVSNPSKKFTDEDMIAPQDSKDFLKRGPQNEQPRLVKFEYLVVLIGKGKCFFNMCHLIEKNRAIILLETNDKCKND
jgi:hypothetical protein